MASEVYQVPYCAPRVLAPVGQMAFTNYLTQSIMMTALFYGGRGPALFGHLDRPALAAIVVGVWALQIVWSHVWLRHFRLGPFEGVWRRLYRGQSPTGTMHLKTSCRLKRGIIFLTAPRMNGRRLLGMLIMSKMTAPGSSRPQTCPSAIAQFWSFKVKRRLLIADVCCHAKLIARHNTGSLIGSIYASTRAFARRLLALQAGSVSADDETIRIGRCIAQQSATTFAKQVERCVPFETSGRVTGIWIIGFEMGGLLEGQTSPPLQFDVTKPATRLYFDDNTEDRYFDVKGGQPRAYRVELIGKKSLGPVGTNRRIIIVSKLLSIRRVPTPRVVASGAR